MKPLAKIIENPSGWDSLANYAGDIPDPAWLCLMTRSRDSDVLTESNWECALKALGGEGVDVEIFRFGHWACGWWEALAVKEGSDKQEPAQEIYDSLEDYPVLDEDDFNLREQEKADTVWRDCYDWKDRIKYIRKNRYQFEFHGMQDLLDCIRGNYFPGYASELLT